jgi:hypothetical protein
MNEIGPLMKNKRPVDEQGFFGYLNVEQGESSENVTLDTIHSFQPKQQ